MGISMKGPNKICEMDFSAKVKMCEYMRSEDLFTSGGSLGLKHLSQND